MPTFQKCGPEIEHLAKEILNKYETHADILAAGVRIDFVFAFGDTDPDSGERTSDAIKDRGRRVFGQARKIKLKDRAMGRGDAEICIDGDWWTEEATPAMRKAMLDHELHHLQVRFDKAGNVKVDDLQRPELKLREHDVEVGWFSIIAARHGVDSMEQIQARNIHERFGQYFWPEITGESAATAGKGETLTKYAKRFAQLATT